MIVGFESWEVHLLLGENTHLGFHWFSWVVAGERPDQGGKILQPCLSMTAWEKLSSYIDRFVWICS